MLIGRASAERHEELTMKLYRSLGLGKSLVVCRKIISTFVWMRPPKIVRVERQDTTTNVLGGIRLLLRAGAGDSVLVRSVPETTFNWSSW